MKRITVLLADDSAGVRRDIREMLKLEDDLKVVGEAGNGREAVALVKKLHPALVLMDVAMPLLNGLQATPDSQSGPSRQSAHPFGTQC